MFQKIKTKKASVLVVAMTIFFILLIIALGISGFAIIERKSSGTSSQSDKAFQIADTGVEIVRGKLSGFLPTDSLSAYGNKLSCGISGDVDGSIPSGGSYVVSFYAADGITKLNCNTAQYSAVAMIKSVGTYSGATRAVEVAVAAGPAITFSGQFSAGDGAQEPWKVCFLSGSSDGADCTIANPATDRWRLFGLDMCRMRCLNW